MVLGILCSCSNDDGNDSQIIDMRINHFQNTGIALSPILILEMQKGNTIGTESWTKFYSYIEGFNYEPGKIYNLSVKIENIDNPTADGSSVNYTLVEVKSTQDVDTETLFDIDLKIGGESFVTTDSGLKLLNQIDIDCNTLCNELETTIQNQDFVVGTFKRISNDEIQLIELN